MDGGWDQTRADKAGPDGWGLGPDKADPNGWGLGPDKTRQSRPYWLGVGSSED